MENFYWQKGNQWDDNPREKEEIDITGMILISEEKVCCFCDEKNCNDYIGIDGVWGQDFYCKNKQCKFELNNNKFEVNKTYETPALYDGTLIIKVISITENTITYIHTDDTEQHTQNIILQNNIESIEAWEYKENKCYWYAKEC